MCGIVGSLVRIGDQSLEKRVLAACKALFHRGPNDQGIIAQDSDGGKICLGHRRLSIIDLSDAGNQPMRTSDGRYSMVFNGEIYNYKELRKELRGLGYGFDSNSDSEVLLVAWQAWGESCLNKLKGMYSFVIFDKVTQTLNCVRDPYGIKPFFYCNDGDGFHFASEIGAIRHLIRSKLELNFQRAYYYLVYGRYDDAEDTFFDGVQHLMPGHIMRVDCSRNSFGQNQRTAPERFEINRWWWPSIEQRNDITFSEATEELREIFLSNIRLHMRSDVPLGAALSGGIDSSAVVCAMRHLEPDMPIHTFSYIAKGTPVDEENWVDLVNQRVGASENKIFISPDEILSDLPKVIQAQGEPVLSASVYSQFRVFQRVKERGITVTLDGQGADELLAGYDSFVGARLHSLFNPGNIAEMIRFLSNWRKRNSRSISFALSHLLENLSSGFVHRALHSFHKSPKPNWLDESEIKKHGVRLFCPSTPASSVSHKRRRLMEKLRYSLTGFGLNSLLRHADRNSMFWSIESRVPFLTQDVAEFALRLPEHFLFSNEAETKSIFRAAMRDIVPPEILKRKDKIGFICPEKQIQDNLLMELKQRERLCCVRMGEVDESIQPDQLWRLVNFSIWTSQNDICT
jgi:asparagine synthase (glutamine-hydrolysing)